MNEPDHECFFCLKKTQHLNMLIAAILVDVKADHNTVSA